MKLFQKVKCRAYLKKETCEDYKYGIEHGFIPFGCSKLTESETELKPTKDLINDIVGFDISGLIEPLPEFKESEVKK